MLLFLPFFDLLRFMRSYSTSSCTITAKFMIIWSSDARRRWRNATLGSAFEGLQCQWRDGILEELCTWHQVTFHGVLMNYVTSEVAASVRSCLRCKIKDRHSQAIECMNVISEATDVWTNSRRDATGKYNTIQPTSLLR